MLQVSALSHHYSTFSCCFDFTVNTGEIVAIVGESGSGKSTLLSLLCGLLDPHSGTASFKGEDFLALEPHLRPLSILFQEHNLFEHLDVFTNIALGIAPHLRLTHQQKEQVKMAAEQVQLTEHLQKRPEQLSGGQRQRVALARVLARRRPLLLLDEPFSALNPELKAQMFEQVKQMVNTYQTTVLLVTHDVQEMWQVVDRMLVVKNGAIVDSMTRK
ncbi:MAG: thiamine ABC transporter ATP-binding protein [Vibrionaceae bacterium]